MPWYEKLKRYFPVEEMKSRDHMELLLKEKGNLYYKDEGKHHIMMYAETDEFLFIDYLWVSGEARGQGIGGKLLREMKKKQKSIILEVEPIDYDDSDSEKRLRFYSREDFLHAQSIGYNNQSFTTDDEAPLEILYWSPNDESDEFIYEQMKRIYETIHTYKNKEVYGKELNPVDKALTYDKNRKIDNLLKDNEK